eukprot:TRINITY_DN4174_c0_g1_i1.p1 TRINITY_DN4174_c0_g1~~TRINITY_DN4174_c0_g1_i1.p1  ORF type:complete len:270 (+),score=54.73 TRINITY_DN4174_c0_g1_i1:52-861(+)
MQQPLSSMVGYEGSYHYPGTRPTAKAPTPTPLERGECKVFDPYQEVSMGTSIMAVRFKDGVIIGADSRTSMGTYIANRVSNKLTQVGDRIFCCRSGSAADTQAVARIVAHSLEQHSMEKGKLPLVKTAAKLFQQICYTYRHQLSAGIIVAGWDPLEGGKVFSVNLGGSCIERQFTLGGSGSTYIYGWVDEHFRENMTKEEALNFIRTALAHATARDGSSGGAIRTAVITADGVEDAVVHWPVNAYSLEKDPAYSKLVDATAPVSVAGIA